jgi:hypothetical protein
MTHVFKLSSHDLFNSNFTWINLQLYFLNVFHDQLAFAHLNNDGLHLQLFEIFQYKFVDVTNFSWAPKNSHLCHFIHAVDIIWQKFFVIIEVNLVYSAICTKVFILVTNNLSEEILWNVNDNYLEGILLRRLHNLVMLLHLVKASEHPFFNK